MENSRGSSDDRFSLLISQKIDPIIQKIKKNHFILLLPILFILIGIFLAQNSGVKNKQLPGQSPDYTRNVLLVENIWFENPTLPSAVSLRFNNPVDIHELSHYFSLSPEIKGKWEIDKYDKKVVHYIFDKKYKGYSVSIHIGQGLTSLKNKTLLNDYETTLWSEVKSRHDQTYSRVKSYPAGKAVPFSTDIEFITIYKSNSYNLLSFLKYSLPDKDRRSIYDGSFIQDDVKHSEKDKIKNLSINKEKNEILLDPGVYYVEDDFDQPYFIVVSSFGVLLRQDDKKVVLGTFNLNNGSKINDSVTIGLYNLNEGVSLLKDFVYSESSISQPLEYPARLDAIIAIYKDEVAFIPVELPSSFADINVTSNLDTDTKIFIYTDRPIYKPGDKVFVKGIIRQDSDSLYRPPPFGTAVYFNFLDKSEFNQTLTIDEYGTFYTYFTLPDDYEGQYSYVKASTKPLITNNYRYSSASFEVLKYKKPEFEIKTKIEKNEYLRSDKLKFTISGNYFDNKPLANKEVEYTIFTDNYYEVEKAVYNKNFNIISPGGMCGGGGFEEYFGNEFKKGNVTLNDKGEALVEIDPDKSTPLSQKLTLVAKITDRNSNEILSASNVIVHASEFNIFFIPSADKYTLSDEIIVPFYAENITGEKMKNSPFSYKLVDSQYNQSYDKDEKNIIASGAVITDDNGKGIVKFVFPKDKFVGGKQLILSSKDSKGNDVQNQKAITISQSEEKQSPYSARWGDRITQTYLKISSDKSSFKVNDILKLNIQSPKDLDVLLTFERGRIYFPQFHHLKKGNNTIEFNMKEEMSPSITVVFSFFADGEYRTEGLSLNVPAMHKLLQISLSANKSLYSADDTAELTVTTKDASGAPVAAHLSVGVVDKAIYALRKSATPPIHSSFYYFRSRRTNASSSLTGMGDLGGFGGGGGGGGGGAPGSNADILYWNPNLRTDDSGVARIPIPLLGHKTIWKVQVMGSTINSEVGQADTEFIVNSQVQGVKTKKDLKRN